MFYHPLKGGVGYTDVPMGEDSYQLSYVGTSDMPVAQAWEYCLLRAAELAVLRNDPYFQILNERVYLSYGSQYWPGEMEPMLGGYGRRRYAYISGYYDPGYYEVYAVPEVTMRVQVTAEQGKDGIPARDLIEKAVWKKTALTPGVAERARTMPAGPMEIPPPPPSTRPAQ